MIEVVLATHNGEQTLTMMLQRLLVLKAPPVPWRLSVIDNASTDQTRPLIFSYADRLNVRLFECPERGKNRALNSALPFLEGDLVVFTDDDVLPAPDWLIKYHEVADRNPNYSIFGGVIEPHWCRSPPDWVKREVHLGIVFALTPNDLVTGPVPATALWGPNFAVRSGVLRSGFVFDETIGPSSGEYMMGSETEFLGRAEAAGYAAWFDSDVRVQHIVREHQLQFDWIVNRAFRFGRAKANREPIRSGGRGYWFGLPRWMWRELMQRKLLGLGLRALAQEGRAFPHAWRARLLEGMIYEYRRIHRRDGI